MNASKISRYWGFAIALFMLAVALPTANAQDLFHFNLGPKPPNVVPADWPTRNTRNTPPPEVWMPDENLRMAVEAELRACNPPLTLTQDNLGILSSIRADGKDKSPITNITGLEHATSLTWLDLQENNITDITPLSGLMNLTELDLGLNNITDIRLIAVMVNLEQLNLGGNTINDISVLSGLTSLTRLSLSQTGISDISDLAPLTSLTNLYLASNSLIVIDTLSNFGSLESLSLYHNRNDNSNGISDISALAGLTNLTFLHLGRNDISDITALSNLTSLDHLFLRGNNITEIDTLANLPLLLSLSLDFNDLDDDDLTHLSDLTTLEVLSLGANELTDISDLSGLVNMRYLDLTNNSVFDITPLAGMENLTHLSLSSNVISDITPLAGMENMLKLLLSGNRIRRIIPLLNMEVLEKVDLSVNPVDNIYANTYTVETLLSRGTEVIIDDLEDVTDIGFKVPLDVKPASPVNETFQVLAEFRRSVVGFEVSELVLDPTTIASITSQTFTITETENGFTYAVDVTPTGSGEVTFRVAEHVMRDDQYNRNAPSDPLTVVIDLVDPDVSLDVPSGIQTAPFEVDVVFDETVSGFEANELVLDPTTIAFITPNSLEKTDDETNNTTTYTVEITPVADGDITFSVAAGVATDLAGNPNTAAATERRHLNVPEPEVSIIAPSGVQNEAFTVTITFTETVSDFVSSDIVLGGLSAKVSNLDPNGVDASSFIATITPTVTTPGEITIDVPADVANNTVGTLNTAAPTQTVSVDLPPEVNLTVLSDVANGPFQVSVVFSESVSGFDEGELVLSGDAMASKAMFTEVDAATYTAEITPMLSGEVTFNVAAGIATDDSNLDNIAAEPLTVPVDLFVEIPDPNLLRRIRNTLDLDANASVTESQMASLTSITYPGDNRPGNRRIHDLTGLEYATNLENLGIRNNRISDPTPIVNLTSLRSLSLAGNSNIDSISFLTNLTNLEKLYLWNNDIEHISGNILENLTALTFLSLKRNPIINTAANRETRRILRERLGSNLKIDPFVDDEGAPEVEISVPSGVQNAPFEVTFTFTEPVFGFVASDIVLGRPTATATDPQQDSEDVKVYVATITPTDTLAGNITIDLPEDAVTDEASNGNTAATTQTVAVDLPPNVSIYVPPGRQYGAFDVTITFSEPVAGFAEEDIVLSGTATAETTGFRIKDGKRYIVEISTSSKGDLTVSVPTGVATDAANNGNIAATSEPVPVDVDFVIEFPDTNLAAAIRPAVGLGAGDDILASRIQNLNSLMSTQRPSDPNLVKISNLSGLEYATNLKTLNFYANNVTDPTVLTKLPNLTWLNLSSNSLTDVTVLGELTNLTFLNIRRNQITDISPLSTLTTLTSLLLMGNPILDTSPIYPLTQNNLTYVDISVSEYPPWDVNEDGSVDATDSALVTAALGQRGTAIADPRTDVNGDRIVNNADLLLVTNNLDDEVEAAPDMNLSISQLLDPAALQSVDREALYAQLEMILAESDGSLKYRHAIALIETFLAATRPKETQLLVNYPNPFNPETWIPYHLANASNVQITIYDVHGTVVRRLDLGHQRDGYYTNRSRAAYWDGRNAFGERVASGIYFYQLEADNLSLLRKMVILK